MSVETEGAESLDAPTPETLDAPVVDQTTDTAESSPADGDAPTVLSVVRDVVDKRAPASQAKETGETATGDTPAGDTAKQDDEDFSDVPFNKHPRWQQVIQQRNAYRDDAGRYQNIVKFGDENGLTGEDMAEALHIAALMKRDPMKAWEQMKPMVQDLATRAGVILPADLREMVQSGRLTQEAAKLVATERAKAEALRAGSNLDKQAAERRQQQIEMEKQQAAALAVRTTVSTWEADKRKDPDFGKLTEDLQARILFLQHRDGKPTTPEKVRQQLDQAYADVKKARQRMAPRRPDMIPVTGGSRGGNPGNSPETVLDIIRASRGAR
jgi:hypothetical protein